MRTSLYRYGTQANSHDVIKTCATVFMIIDHIGYYVFPQYLFLRLLGRAAAPLFFYASGTFRSHTLRPSLWLYGLILTFCNYQLDHHIYFNILINFVLIKAVLDTLTNIELDNGTLKLAVLIALIFNPLISPFLEYGTCGILFALSARLSADNDSRAKVVLIVALIQHFFYETLGFYKIIGPQELILLGLVFAVVSAVLLLYKQRVWNFNSLLTLPILFIGRYSLHIYFWHLFLFKILFVPL